MNKYRGTPIVTTLKGMLVVMPSAVEDNQGQCGGGGVALFLQLLPFVYALLFIINLILFVRNVFKKSKLRAVFIIIFSVFIVAVSGAALLLLQWGQEVGFTLFCAIMTVVHIAMIAASRNVIMELGKQTRDNR